MECSPPQCAGICRENKDCGWFLHLESLDGHKQKCAFFKNGPYGPRIINKTYNRKLASWYTVAYVKQRLDKKSKKIVKNRGINRILSFSSYEKSCAAKRPVYDSREPCINNCALGVKVDADGLQIQ